MPRLWIRDPLAIFADGADRGLIVEDHRITELVAAGQEPRQSVDTVFDASQHVVLPGLVNTHHHFYQTLTRALVPALGKELFGWLRALYPVWAGLDPEMLSVATELALAELLLSGCTTTSDHHYIYPAGLEQAVDIQAEVASQLGIRVMLTRGSMDRSVKDGGLPPDTVVQKLDAILADCERVVAIHHQLGPGAMIQVALAPCSPFSVSGELMRETAALAGRLDVRTHTHLGETQDENQYCDGRLITSKNVAGYSRVPGWPTASISQMVKSGASVLQKSGSVIVLTRICILLLESAPRVLSSLPALPWGSGWTARHPTTLRTSLKRYDRLCYCSGSEAARQQ